jgi:hypothetical protein
MAKDRLLQVYIDRNKCLLCGDARFVELRVSVLILTYFWPVGVVGLRVVAARRTKSRAMGFGACLHPSANPQILAP